MEKKVIEYTRCVLIFSTNLSETFLIHAAQSVGLLWTCDQLVAETSI
jgi:hypothetical protein